MTINFDKVPSYIKREIDKGAKEIKTKQKGRRVRQIQEWLNFHDCRTGIDEDFGPATESCVRDFQKKKALTITGRVNKATWDALVAPMRAALQAPRSIGNLTPAKAIRKVAQQHLKQHPIEIGGANEGPWVRLYCGGNHGRAWAWCAGFVSLIMQQAYFYLEQKPPIKGSVSCDSLAAQAKTTERFIPESRITRGDFAWDRFGGCCVFLRRRTDTDWTHTGFALDAEGPARATVFQTIEGNTNDEGSREGYEACARKRGVARQNYDFISLA